MELERRTRLACVILGGSLEFGCLLGFLCDRLSHTQSFRGSNMV